jgi:hypothetical protein
MSWNKILVTGFAASLAIVGCTVTTSSDVGDGSTAGGGSDAGKGTGGGSSTGGAKATGGGSSTGGAKATGGGTSGGGAGGATAADAGPDSDCTKCLKQHCATEYTDCGKDADCAQSSKADGEFLKIQQCMFDITGDASTAFFTSADLAKCAGDSANGSVLATATDALLSCARGELDASLSAQPCTERCFGAPINP